MNHQAAPWRWPSPWREAAACACGGVVAAIATLALREWFLVEVLLAGVLLLGGFRIEPRTVQFTLLGCMVGMWTAIVIIVRNPSLL